MAVNKLLIDLRDPLSSSKKFLSSSEDVEEKQIHPLRRINWRPTKQGNWWKLWTKSETFPVREDKNIVSVWRSVFLGVFTGWKFLLHHTTKKKSVLSWSYVSTSFRAEHIKRTHHGQKSFPKSDSRSQDRLWRWWSAAETVSILINRDVFARKIMKFNIWNS